MVLIKNQGANQTIKKRGIKMKNIGIALIIVGSVGMLLGAMMYGDIGIAAMIGSVVGILSGVGFLKVSKL